MPVSDPLFDAPFYQAINEARWAALMRMIEIAEMQIGPLETVNDLGAGPGWFARRLSDTGRDVLGLDGRRELVEVARQRAPSARFEIFDFDAAALAAIPRVADAVLCFGLLYHLENPLRALRFCRAMTRKVLFLESMTLPEQGPLARVVPENANQTQGIRPLAMLMTPEAILHGLLAAGFAFVYRMDGARIDHPDFVQGADRAKRRDVFLATDHAIAAPDLTLCEPAELKRVTY